MHMPHIDYVTDLVQACRKVIPDAVAAYCELQLLLRCLITLACQPPQPLDISAQVQALLGVYENGYQRGCVL